MRSIVILAMVFACTACTPNAAPDVVAPAPAPAATPASVRAASPPPAAATPPPCQTSTVPVDVGGRSEQATIEACPEPDGSWRITQATPGLPLQVYVMPAAPPAVEPSVSAYPDYGDDFDYWPYWGAGPWFWGIGPAVVIVQHFHHHPHDSDHFRPGFGHPMPHPGGHGFGHAMAAGGGGGGAHR